MHKGGGDAPPGLRQPDRGAQAFCIVEIGDRKISAADLRGVVPVRAGGAGQVVLRSKFQCQFVVTGAHDPGVEDLDGVNERDQHFQRLQPPAGAARVEWMRHADESALVLEAFDGFERLQPSWYFFRDKGSQQLTLGGLHFFTGNDELRCSLEGFKRAADGVVVGHYNAVQPACSRSGDELIDGRYTVL